MLVSELLKEELQIEEQNEVTLVDVVKYALNKPRVEEGVVIDPTYIPVVTREAWGNSSLGYLLLPPKGEGWLVKIGSGDEPDDWAVRIQNGKTFGRRRKRIMDVISEQYPDFKYRTTDGTDKYIEKIMRDGNYPLL